MKLIRSLMGRRQFLGGALAASALGLVSKITGAPSGAAGVAEKAGAEGPAIDSGVSYSKVLKTDVVVLGSGAGGMSAAISARQQGVENVLILEKRAQIGGNSVFAPFPLKKENKRSAEEAFKAAIENTHWRGDPRIIGTMIDKSEKIGDWLRGFSSDLSDLDREGALVKILKAQCDKLGIQIICNTRARKLIKDTNNAVCAVAAVQDVNLIKVEATATVLATGGFLGDPELMERYFPVYDESFYKEINIEGHAYKGDGIKMALEAGAGNDSTISFVWGPNKLPFFKGDLKDFPVTSILTDNTRTPAIWVNNVGVRFTNESQRHAANAIYRQPNRDCFIVVDAGIVEHMAGEDPGVVSVERLDKEVAALIEADQALVTDSVGAVAAWIRGKKHILQAGIDTYNKYCEKGYDELYYKDPAFLVPLTRPPFYVFRSGLSLRTTHGPVKINPMTSVVSQFDWPIPALMACGADIGGLHADILISSEESHSIEWTVASGMCAGENAASYVQGNRPVKVYEFPKYTAKEVMAGNYVNVGTIEGGAPPEGGPPSEDNKSYH
ncbi:MAG: FAD-binding protein [Deltaproteobacteria bacterium]|nr:FAD-binding protein [Deltaproteobacteria bacterium]